MTTEALPPHKGSAQCHLLQEAFSDYPLDAFLFILLYSYEFYSANIYRAFTVS